MIETLLQKLKETFSTPEGLSSITKRMTKDYGVDVILENSGGDYDSYKKSENPSAFLDEHLKKYLAKRHTHLSKLIKKVAIVKGGRLQIYRRIHVPDRDLAVKNIQQGTGKKGTGIYWSWNPDPVDQDISGGNGDAIVLVGLVAADAIDFPETEYANMNVFGSNDENEITLKKNAKVDIVDILDGYKGKSIWPKNTLKEVAAFRSKVHSKFAVTALSDSQKRIINEINDDTCEGVEDDEQEDCLDDNGDTHYFFENPKALPANTWLIHYTKAVDKIIKEGFIGADLAHLGLTRGGGKRFRGDMGLAYTLPDVSEGNVGREFGPEAILFQSSDAVRSYHKGDDENQVIFDVNTMKNVHALRRPPKRDDMFIVEKDGKPLGRVDESPVGLKEAVALLTGKKKKKEKIPF